MNCNCCKLTLWKNENNETKYKNYIKKKAGVIIKYNDKLLLIQSRGNMWGFPKGKIEKNETEKNCAIREVKEETSLIISIDENEYIYLNNTFFFLKELKNEPIINIDEIKNISGNDCTGVGLIKLACLKNSKLKINTSLKKYLNYFT